MGAQTRAQRSEVAWSRNPRPSSGQALRPRSSGRTRSADHLARRDTAPTVRSAPDYLVGAPARTGGRAVKRSKSKGWFAFGAALALAQWTAAAKTLPFNAASSKGSNQATATTVRRAKGQLADQGAARQSFMTSPRAR